MFDFRAPPCKASYLGYVGIKYTRKSHLKGSAGGTVVRGGCSPRLPSLQELLGPAVNHMIRAIWVGRPISSHVYGPLCFVAQI